MIRAEQAHEIEKNELVNQQEDYYLEKIKSYLQNLYIERDKLQCDLREIEKNIEKMEEQTQIPISKGLSMLIKRLAETEVLAQNYSMIILNKFPNLKKEVELDSGSVQKFMIEIEGWIEKVYDALIYNNLSFLDCSNPQLYLLHHASYQYADVCVYKELFNVMKEDLSRYLPEEVKNNLFECIDSLEAEMLRFV